VKFRTPLALLEVLGGGRFSTEPCDALRRCVFGVFGRAVSNAGDVGLEMGLLELLLPGLLFGALGGCGKEPILMVFLSDLVAFCTPCGTGTRGKLGDGAWCILLGPEGWRNDCDEGDRDDGRGKPVEEPFGVGVCEESELRVFGTGSEGRGPDGGREGRGRVVVAIAGGFGVVADHEDIWVRSF
jgi:hypothetical protein